MSRRHPITDDQIRYADGAEAATVDFDWQAVEVEAEPVDNIRSRRLEGVVAVILHFLTASPTDRTLRLRVELARHRLLGCDLDAKAVATRCHCTTQWVYRENARLRSFLESM